MNLQSQPPHLLIVNVILTQTQEQNNDVGQYLVDIDTDQPTR